ncbi:Cyclic nucleotide-binding domain [Trypanosoma melophagium]|uniref:Cyclic nucleotide-binding domain n=1 Tax=Trypanosoma melophagium TaxID=715481 RepID=UPI00351AA4DA|nr:Cyclic nucleotide-binding domain [Trypanosoma melophagium]
MDTRPPLFVRNTAGVHPFLPTAAQLRSFPQEVAEEVRGIAIAVLRRLLYPIIQRRIASKHRKRNIDAIHAREMLQTKMVAAFEQISALATCLHSLDMSMDMTHAHDAIREVFKSADYRIFVQREFIQHHGEPCSGVMIVLTGSVRKQSLLARSKGMITGGKTHSRPSTSTHSLIQQEEMSQTSRVSSAAGSIRRCSTSSNAGEFIVSDPLLHAPAVFGEYSTIGAFPCIDSLVADSLHVVTATISKASYYAIMETLPKRVQQEFLLRSLELREKFLPQFAPMTTGRMRLCPLLSGLSDANLLHLMDYLIPQVRPAGMQIGEPGVPAHIFFIRRGLVHLQQDQSFVADMSSPMQPKSRSLLLDGHTFGERQCIFREALGDTVYAITNVDLYLLPFSVLIQFMKQDSDARSTIYAAAKSASLLLEKEFEGMRFLPSSLENLGIVLLGSAKLSRWFQRRVSITTVGLRRETIDGVTARDMSLAMQTGKNGSTYGVSPHFLAKVRRIPLLSLCSPDNDFYEECARRWTLLSFEAGEYIIHRGEECNRLLLFIQGGAAIVRDETKLTQDAQSNHILLTPPSSSAHLPRVPKGCIVGYTCVRRHPWSVSVVAMDSQVEVWELRRATFVELLRKHQLERKMQELALQLLQPLMQQPSRSVVLDLQPLLLPSPNSLWSEQAVPNMHPVSFCEYMRYPVWREGDLPLGFRNNRRISSFSSP